LIQPTHSFSTKIYRFSPNKKRKRCGRNRRDFWIEIYDLGCGRMDAYLRKGREIRVRENSPLNNDFLLTFHSYFLKRKRFSIRRETHQDI
jgi:hypothetical protein